MKEPADQTVDLSCADIDLRNIITGPMPGGTGSTWTLASRLGRMMAELEMEYGERDKSYVILGVEFWSGVPHIWYPDSCKSIIIKLNLNALKSHEQACYQLAHEAVHLLSRPCGAGATVLEEGIATVYSSRYMLNHFGRNWYSSVPSYKACSTAYRQLEQLDPTAVKKLRQLDPCISNATADAICSVCPELDRSTAEYLAQPFARE